MRHIILLLSIILGTSSLAGCMQHTRHATLHYDHGYHNNKHAYDYHHRYSHIGDIPHPYTAYPYTHQKIIQKRDKIKNIKRQRRQAERRRRAIRKQQQCQGMRDLPYYQRNPYHRY